MRLRKKQAILLGIFILLAIPAFAVSVDKQVHIYHDQSEASIRFAAEDMKGELLKQGMEANLSSLRDISSIGDGIYFVIAKNDPYVLKELHQAGGAKIKHLAAQEYAFRKTQNGEAIIYWAIGGDRIGAMYGGIHLAEILKVRGLEEIGDEDHRPYIP